MKTHEIIDRLDKVRSAGTDKWLALCPAHDDKTPSLAIKDAGDRTLFHCFAGCSTESICASIGIGVHDLFIDGNKPRQIAPGVSRKQLADALETELLILAQLAHKRAHGEEISDNDSERERIAWQRVDAARRSAQ